MPELPEVETIKRELHRALVGQTIAGAKVLWPKTVAPLSSDQFRRRIGGRKILSVSRIAKMLVCQLSGDKQLVFHLKMTGQLIYRPAKGRAVIGGHLAPQDEKILPNSHTRLILKLTGGTLYFNDLRKFGWARLLEKDDQLPLDNLGLEPLSKNFTDQALVDIFQRRPRRTIKQILLDQTLIGGLGNIYTDESCFLAKLRPNRRANTLTPAQIKKLRREIVAVLKHSIAKKGTSARNYVRSDGRAGGFTSDLMVYDRAGQLCKICGTPIKKTKHAGRGTHFCPKCQK